MVTRGFANDRSKKPAEISLCLIGREPAIQSVLGEFERVGLPHTLTTVSQTEADACILILRPTTSEPDRSWQLNELANALRDHLAIQGCNCTVADYPVILISLHFAPAIDTPASDYSVWTARAQSGVIEKFQQFLEKTPTPGFRTTAGFSSPTHKCHALSIPGASAVEPDGRFAAQTVLGEIESEATRYHARKRRQGRRVGGALFLLAALLGGLAASSAWLLQGITHPEQHRALNAQVEFAELNQRIETRLEELARFKGFFDARGVQWVQWYIEAEHALKAAAALCQESDRAGARLKPLIERVFAISDYLLFLGLVQDSASDVIPLPMPTDELPSLLNVQKASQAIVHTLSSKSHAATWKDMPQGLPRVVAEELKAALEIGYENWLAPVRLLIAEQLGSIEGKSHTQIAALVSSWLDKGARNNLDAWHTVANFLRQCNGRVPTDLIADLLHCLDIHQVQVNLDEIGLLLPSEFVSETAQPGKWTIEGLLVELRSKDQLKEVRRFKATRKMALLGEDRSMVRFQAIDRSFWSTPILTINAGDRFTATVQLNDEKGKTWHLSWGTINDKLLWMGLEVVSAVPFLTLASTEGIQIGKPVHRAKWLSPMQDDWTRPDLLPKASVLKTNRD